MNEKGFVVAADPLGKDRVLAVVAKNGTVGERPDRNGPVAAHWDAGAHSLNVVVGAIEDCGRRTAHIASAEHDVQGAQIVVTRI